jgi:peroxiredoxin Q/BCP
MIKRIAATALAALLVAAPSYAALKAGDAAPDFQTQASLDGKVFTFSLADALKKGPVVLYFYPAAFTTGCTIEAHDFADAVDKYRALGATVIGVSHDDINTLNRFSVSECRSKFAVAADQDQARVRKPRVVCDCSRRAHRLRIHVAQSRKACREHPRRASQVVGTAEEVG